MSSYIGTEPAAGFATLDRQSLTGDGGTGYTLDHAVANENEIEVFVNNVRQEPGTAYTVSGTTLTMTGNVASTDDFYVVYQGKAIQTTSHPAGQDLQARDGTFTGDLTVDTDTLHVDASSDVVRVGKTSGGVTTDGWQLSAGASHYAIPSGQYFILNRTTSGAATMIDFRSENTSKGGITYNGTNVSFTSGSNNIFNQSGISFDNGSNYLDEYEQGSWTPVAGGLTTSGTFTGTNQVGKYTKIGNLVNVWFDCDGTISGAAGNFTINGLPYSNANATEPVGTLMWNLLNTSGNDKQLCLFIGSGNNYIRIFQSTDNGTWTLLGVSNEQIGIRGQITYMTSG